MKEYNKSNIPLARTLRKNMTPWERKLWYQFLRSYPVRFQRQKAIGEYINIIKCEKIGTFEICKVHKNDILKLLGGSNE